MGINHLNTKTYQMINCRSLSWKLIMQLKLVKVNFKAAIQAILVRFHFHYDYHWKVSLGGGPHQSCPITTSGRTTFTGNIRLHWIQLYCHPIVTNGVACAAFGLFEVHNDFGLWSSLCWGPGCLTVIKVWQHDQLSSIIWMLIMVSTHYSFCRYFKWIVHCYSR